MKSVEMQEEKGTSDDDGPVDDLSASAVSLEQRFFYDDWRRFFYLSQNPLATVSFIFLDAMILGCLSIGLLPDGFDGRFSFHLYTGLNTGIYPYVYPAILIQYFLLELVLDCGTSWFINILSWLDIASITSLLICAFGGVDFGYYRSLGQYLGVQLTAVAIPVLLAEIIVVDVLILASKIVEYILHRIDLSNIHYLRLNLFLESVGSQPRDQLAVSKYQELSTYSEIDITEASSSLDMHEPTNSALMTIGAVKNRYFSLSSITMTSDATTVVPQQGKKAF